MTDRLETPGHESLPVPATATELYLAAIHAELVALNEVLVSFTDAVVEAAKPQEAPKKQHTREAMRTAKEG